METHLESNDFQVQLMSLKNKEDDGFEYVPNLDDLLIPCKEIEAISGASYAYLIAESVKNQKGFIFARVKTRSNQDHTKKFYHYFYAANLIQLLVRPNISFLDQILNEQNQHLDRDDNKKHILRSRYHNDYPLTVKNPLTNQVIVGDVEFYIVQKEQVR